MAFSMFADESDDFVLESLSTANRFFGSENKEYVGQNFGFGIRSPSSACGDRHDRGRTSCNTYRFSKIHLNWFQIQTRQAHCYPMNLCSEYAIHVITFGILLSFSAHRIHRTCIDGQVAW